MTSRADKIRDEQWLRDGEVILSWRDGAVVCRDGLRARSAVVCTDDRVCVCDTRTTLPYDQLELGHVTAAEYFAPNALFVLSSGDTKRLLVRTSVEAARATVAAAAQHIPLMLAVRAEHVAAHEAGALLAALPSPAAAAAACTEAAAALPRLYAAAARPPPPPTLAFVCGKTVPCPRDVALGGSAEERELAQTLGDAEVRLADLSAWGRGRGLLATRAYAPGDVVWAEEPLVSWQSGEEMEVAEEVFQAEGKRVARLVGLLQAHEAGPVVVPDETPAGGKPPGEWYRRWAEVLQANCWGYTPFEEDCRALLLLGSLVNHSCLPNVRYDTKDGRAAAVFRAVAPIQPGDELTATYTQMLPTLQRQEELRKDRRFTCTCEKCAGPDAARSIACPTASCRGAVVPRSAADGDTAGWLCGACGGTFGAAAMASAVKAEAWVSLLAATHAAVELTDVSAHLAAALAFAARHLGARHWTVVFLAEHTLCVDTQGDLSADACELLVRLVLNWTREVDPTALRVRPTVAQALGNAVGKLQASTTSSVAIISLARVLAPAFATLRGTSDADAQGMRTVSELSPGAVDALAGVDWHGFRGGAGGPDDSAAFRTLVSSGADFAGRVTDRLRVLEDAYERGIDAYDV